MEFSWRLSNNVLIDLISLWWRNAFRTIIFNWDIIGSGSYSILDELLSNLCGMEGKYGSVFMRIDLAYFSNSI